MAICLYAYMPICLYAYMPICLYAYILAETIVSISNTNKLPYMLICLYAYMLICDFEDILSGEEVLQFWTLFCCDSSSGRQALSLAKLLCLYAYMPICLYAYMPICLYAYMPICLYAYMLICLNHISPYMLICLYAYMLICLYAYILAETIVPISNTNKLPYMLICLYAYMLICLYAYMRLRGHPLRTWGPERKFFNYERFFILTAAPADRHLLLQNYYAYMLICLYAYMLIYDAINHLSI